MASFSANFRQCIIAYVVHVQLCFKEHNKCTPDTVLTLTFYMFLKHVLIIIQAEAFMNNSYFNTFTPPELTNTYLLLTISIYNKWIGYDNIRTDYPL